MSRTRHPSASFAGLIAAGITFAFLLGPLSRAQTRSLEHPKNAPERERIKEREEWFLQGRQSIKPGLAASLRAEAFKQRLQLERTKAQAAKSGMVSALNTSVPWQPLGPSPVNSDSFGNGFLNYGPVVGRVTAVAVDQSDASGNTVYIGAAEGGIWKSTNAANSNPSVVGWNPLTDFESSLATGAIAISPVNHNLVLVGTGEPDSALDSYFGTGILRSTDGGTTWTQATSLTGAGVAKIAFSTANPNLVVAAIGYTVAAFEGYNFGQYGLLSSTDAGLTWYWTNLHTPYQYALTGATDVVFNAAAGKFFAVVRGAGLYSSPDGVNWTRLVQQPGPALSGTCDQIISCGIYRGQLTVPLEAMKCTFGT